MAEQENTATVTEPKDSNKTVTIDILPSKNTDDVTNNDNNIVVVPTNTSSSTGTDSSKDKDNSPLVNKHLQKSPSPATKGKQVIPVLSRADTGPGKTITTATTQSNTVIVTSRRYNNIEDIITPTTGMETPIQNKNITGSADLQVKQKRNSLRRANIPPPLGLQSGNNNHNGTNNSTPTSSSSSAASTHFNQNGNPQNNNGNTVTVQDSNKLHIPLKGRNPSSTLRNGSPNHGGITKPRVRYLGKMSRYPTEQTTNINGQQQGTAAPYRRSSAQLQAQAQFNAMLLYNQQQQQQQQQQYINTMMMMGMYPYMYNENMPLSMPLPMQMGIPPQTHAQMDMSMNLQPKFTMLPNFPPQTYPYFRNQSTIDSSSSSLLNKSGYQGIDNILNNHQVPQAQAPPHAPVQTPIDHTRTSTTRQPSRNISPNKQGGGGIDSGDDPNDNNDSESDDDDDDDDEDSDLAIESDALPTPIFTRRPAAPEMMQGEIRIMQNKFSFEFPVTNSQVDRKMFLSICNKIWVESRELEKDVK